METPENSYEDSLKPLPNSIGEPGEYYARMLNVLYGENTLEPHAFFGITSHRRPNSEMQAVLTFLTDKDPFFPSWEFSYIGSENLQAFHPRFAVKMARIEEAWKEFEAGRAGTASQSPQE